MAVGGLAEDLVIWNLRKLQR